MAKQLEIRDFEGAMVVVARRGFSIVNAVLGAVASGSFMAIAFRHRVGTLVLLILTVLAVCLSLELGLRQQHAELRITSVEFRSRARFGDSFRSTRRLNAEEVYWLEYQKDTTGPETSHHPGGLYAVLSGRSACVLPYVDEEEAGRIIQMIGDRFPSNEEAVATTNSIRGSFYNAWARAAKSEIRFREGVAELISGQNYQEIPIPLSVVLENADDFVAQRADFNASAFREAYAQNEELIA